MTFPKAIVSGFSKYATFSGRASRSEFWWFALLFAIAMIGSIIPLEEGYISFSFRGGVALLLFLSMIVPYFSVLVRRLHDVNKPGIWLFISFIPLIGHVLIIMYLASKGDKGANLYGAPPIPHTMDEPEITEIVEEPVVEVRDTPIPDVQNVREPTVRRY